MTPRPVHVIGTTAHHTATRDHDPDPIGTWRAIAHEATSGGLAEHYAYTPYNAGVCKLAAGVGAVLLGRPNNVIGAHARSNPAAGAVDSWAGTANLYTLGAALVGTEPTPEALAALAAYHYVAALTGAGLLFDHEDWARWGGITTACSGAGMRAAIAAIRAGRSPF